MDNDTIKRRIKTQILKSYKIFNHTHLRLSSHQLQMVEQIHPAISAVLETIILKVYKSSWMAGKHLFSAFHKNILKYKNGG